MYRVSALLLLVSLGAACASAPPAAAPPAVSFETKMSWILRLEDQRILRDAAVPMAPPPVVSGKKGAVAAVPPPPPDLLRLMRDPEARVRRRAALAVGRVGLAADAAPDLITVMRSDADPEVRQMAAFALGLLGDKSPATIDALKLALADPSPIVTGRAAEALGLIGDAATAGDIGKLVSATLGATSTFAPDESRYPM